MKEFKFYLMSTCMLLLLFIPTPLKAEKETNKLLKAVTFVVESSKTDTLTNNTAEEKSYARQVRLEEIDAIDMGKISQLEKRKLQKEVSSIQKDQNHFHKQSRDLDYNRGVIFSVGIALLLLLLLIFNIK